MPFHLCLWGYNYVLKNKQNKKLFKMGTIVNSGFVGFLFCFFKFWNKCVHVVLTTCLLFSLNQLNMFKSSVLSLLLLMLLLVLWYIYNLVLLMWDLVLVITYCIMFISDTCIMCAGICIHFCCDLLCLFSIVFHSLLFWSWELFLSRLTGLMLKTCMPLICFMFLQLFLK